MEHEFKVYSPLTSKSVERFITKSDDGTGERILLEGIASTTSRDLQDEIVSKEAIESMAEQAMMKGLNIHGDHWYTLNDVIGAIKDASVEDDQLKIEFLITKKYTPDIKDLLETGVKLGLSIGGYVTSYDEKNRIINAIELHEISLTAMPANWDTFGTVTSSKGIVESTCFAGACYEIVKNIDNEMKTMTTMTTKELKTKEEESTSEGLTQDDVIALINEYMAEKEETIVQEITEKVESQLGAIVDAKLEELNNDDNFTVDEEEEENKANTDEEEEEETTSEEEDEDEEDKTKSKEPTVDVVQLIADSVDKALGDDFVDKVASKMFGKLDQNRTSKGSKFEQYMKTKQTESEGSTEEPVEKSTYSTKETAEILLKKQQAANPIVAAAMKNLQ